MCRESDLFMKIKTAELTGKALNYAVAVAEGYTVRNNPTFDGKRKSGFWVEVKKPKAAPWLELNWLNYCVAWSYGGPIIERERIQVVFRVTDGNGGGYWEAANLFTDTYGYSGATPLLAAMRCYVASKLGTEVEIPYALL